MKWWLISDEVLREIRVALSTANLSCGSGIITRYRDALYSLESGMHQTDAVPADWVKPAAEGDAR